MFLCWDESCTESSVDGLCTCLANMMLLCLLRLLLLVFACLLSKLALSRLHSTTCWRFARSTLATLEFLPGKRAAKLIHLTIQI